MERAKRTPLRSEVAMEETWDLTDLFRTEADWREELTAIRREVKTVTRFKGKVCESAKNLLDALLAKDALLERLNRAAIYAFLNQAADGTDPVFQANASLADSLSSDVHAAISFIDSEIMEADAETLNRYMEEEKGLQEFRKVLADLMEKKPHKLHPEAEEALAAFGEIHNAPYAIYQRSKTSDMRFSPFRTKDGTEHPLTFNSFPKYEESADTELRRKAYRAFVEGLNRYKNTYAAAYATEVKKHVIEAALRKYASATDMLLAGQQVTKEMYHGLLDTILAELSPHMRRYAKLKKRVLGLDKFYYCDLKASLDPEYDTDPRSFAGHGAGICGDHRAGAVQPLGRPRRQYREKVRRLLFQPIWRPSLYFDDVERLDAKRLYISPRTGSCRPFRFGREESEIFQYPSVEILRGSSVDAE
jgi:oligoendopeptidase F